MCEYDPETLPDFVGVKNNINPTVMVGHGLGPKDAADITNWMQKNGFTIQSA